MHDTKLTKHFHAALLLALALPAGCGGNVGTDGNTGGSTSSTTSSGTGGPFHPPASCKLTPSKPGPCGGWAFTFTGDPSTCVGFASAGTPDECFAACGTDAAGSAADSCAVAPAGTAGESILACSSTGSTGCFPPGNGGRRPEYFASIGFGHTPPGREVGTHFARVACMEAGSVEAFRTLRAELAAHGAPRRLLRAASRAVRDEMRHVRQTASLARRFGEAPIAPVPPPPRRARSLPAIARENALEGCVRETFSALECAWQAARSDDPVVRATMTRIAKDEMRHLELSWAVHRWAMSRLDRAGREAIRAAQRKELAALSREVAAEPVESLVRVVGLPRASQARALVAAIEAAC